MTTTTADYAELIRCIVRDDWPRYEEKSRQLDERRDWDGWSAFLGGAFVLAVERRFDESTHPTDVIRYVADARADFTPSGSDLDQAAAETMINSVLGRASAAGVNTATVVQVEIVLVRKLLQDAQVSDAALDSFLAEAADLAGEWSSDGPASAP